MPEVAATSQRTCLADAGHTTLLQEDAPMTRNLSQSTPSARRRLLALSLAPALAAFGPIALAQDRSGGTTGATGSTGTTG
jgi:hypothetical protein